jgi:hypothetical protein
MKLHRNLIWGLCLLATAPTFAAVCGESLPQATRQIVTGSGYQIAFAPSRVPIEVSKHFEVSLEVCPEAGNTMPDTVRVDADMPAHRHGMNYRTAVKALGGGRFTADGLMFHMPGQWRFIFEFRTNATPIRLTKDIEVR